MSEVYSLEPATKGKVVIHTTFGPIDIRLWSKEAPLACRTFIQHCLEGYYDGSSFHRVISGFLVQAGLSEHESLPPVKPEFHSRLKFRYRGIVALATPEIDPSQFFITMDKADGLNQKHPIFGKVSGPTIWNVTRIGDVATDERDCPISANSEIPKILSTEVLWNPFEDIHPRTLKVNPVQIETPDETDKPETFSRNMLQTIHKSLISFQYDESAGFVEPSRCMKSAHDFATNDRLLAKVPLSGGGGNAEKITSVRDTISSLKTIQKQEEIQIECGDIIRGYAETDSNSHHQKPTDTTRDSPTRQSLYSESVYDQFESENAKAKVRADGIGSINRQKADIMAIQDGDLMDDTERTRAAVLLRKKVTSRKSRDAEGVAKFQWFQKRLKNNESSWCNNGGLKFDIDSTTAYNYDAAQNAVIYPNRIVILIQLATFDPLVQKAKSVQQYRKNREKKNASDFGPRDIEPW